MRSKRRIKRSENFDASFLPDFLNNLYSNYRDYLESNEVKHSENNEFMITDVITVHKDTKIKQLLETLVNNKIGGFPVVDEANRLKGMISDGDIIRHLQPKGRTIYDMFSLVIVNQQEKLPK